MSERTKRPFWDNYWVLLLGPLAAVVVFALLGLALKLIVTLFGMADALDLSKEQSSESIRNIGLVLGALLAGIAATVFGVWRAIIAGQQTAVARDQYDRSLDRDYADLFTKAVEQLGADKVVKRQAKDADGKPLFDHDRRLVMEEVTEPNIEVRLGAIYALERISKESDKDYIAVLETLCAYVRENAPADGCEDFPITLLSRRDDDPLREKMNWSAARKWWWEVFRASLFEWIKELEVPRADVQAALKVLGRRCDQRRLKLEFGGRNDEPHYKLDLRDTNLRRANMSEGRWQHGYFDRACLEGSTLDHAYYSNAKFTQARFDGATGTSADFSRARFDSAFMACSNFFCATFAESIMPDAFLEGAEITGAMMSGSRLSFCKLEAAQAFGVKLEGRAELYRTDFQAAILSQAKISRAFAEGANFANAGLYGAEMEAATLSKANFAAANLSGARMSGVVAICADFTDVTWGEPTPLDRFFGCAGTKLDNNLARPTHWHPTKLSDISEKVKAVRRWKAARARGEMPDWGDGSS